MTKIHTSRRFDIIFLSVVIAILIVCGTNREAIRDKFFFLGFHPSTQTVKVAGDTNLTPAGRHLFYRTDPQFVSQDRVDAECEVEHLGCLSSGGQAFIVDDPAKPNQTMVTAAHEMLHLAYRRLSSSEKAKLEPQLEQAIEQYSDRIEPELKNQATPEDRLDEAHSLLGTEVQPLSDELEQYYALYFADRQPIVLAAQSEN